MVYNAYTRVFLFAYIIFLHLLVFGTLTRFARWEECRHDHDFTFWRDRLAQATHGGRGLSDEMRKELAMIKEILDKQDQKDYPSADPAVRGS
jgi:hypothetical protein